MHHCVSTPHADLSSCLSCARNNVAPSIRSTNVPKGEHLSAHRSSENTYRSSFFFFRIKSCPRFFSLEGKGWDATKPGFSAASRTANHSVRFQSGPRPPAQAQTQPLVRAASVTGDRTEAPRRRLTSELERGAGTGQHGSDRDRDQR